MMGPMGTRLGVLAGELWLVAGEETGDDSLLSEDPAGEGHSSLSGCPPAPSSQAGACGLLRMPRPSPGSGW